MLLISCGEWVMSIDKLLRDIIWMKWIWEFLDTFFFGIGCEIVTRTLGYRRRVRNTQGAILVVRKALGSSRFVSRGILMRDAFASRTTYKGLDPPH